MTENLRFDIAGTVVELRVPLDVRERVAPRLAAVGSASTAEPAVVVEVPEALEGEGDGRRDWRIRSDGVTTSKRSERDRIATDIASEVHWTVAQRPGPWLFVHSGAVALGGRLVLLPGRSHSGKSTLVAGLLERGATYFSDEYALLDDEGDVHPYPRWLQLRSPSGGEGRDVDPSTLGCPVAHESLRAAVVVCCQYDPAVTEWRPTRHGPARAVLQLIDNTVRARSEPRRMARALASAARECILLEGPRPDVDAMADQLLAEL